MFLSSSQDQAETNVLSPYLPPSSSEGPPSRNHSHNSHEPGNLTQGNSNVLPKTLQNGVSIYAVELKLKG